MKNVPKLYRFLLIILSLVSAAVAQDATSLSSQPVAGVDPVVISDFENRVSEYTKERESIEATLPPLAKQATAKEISDHKVALLKKVLAARKGAKHGYIFTPSASKALRLIIASHYTGRDSMELRKELAEAENKTVPVAVNAVYPEAAELLEMPPKLLLVLPQLPKQVRYRFVGTNLLIVDRESHLIVDYMTNALP